MSRLQTVRGTHDLLPDSMRAHRRIVETARETAGLYGFEEMATPVFEFSEVFRRTLGETSDIVSKEMYTFAMSGGDEITLRPENTAGVVRCAVSEGLAGQAPVKFFYAGPMFRHERPQKGRLRQFHQIGVELIGVAAPQADIEVIAAGVRILDDLGLRERTELQLNTLGDKDSRAAYREVLVSYLSGRKDDLSTDSQERLTRNPLRILDSKSSQDRAIVADAPSFSDSLSDASRDFFDRVREGLDALDIPYRINPRLVRGLDYYCHTAFEFTTGDLGAQDAVMAGGRYDGLAAIMGGPDTPGVGWAAGVERLSMLAGDLPPAPRPVALIPLGDKAEALALRLAENLRATGLQVDLGYGGNAARRMKRANRLNAATAVLIGDDELAQDSATVRDMETGTQTLVSLSGLAEHLKVFR